jgi:ABC-2 type transport system ATP-binding protein
LLKIPGITAIETIQENQIKIHHSITANPAEQLAETIIANGWGLQEMTPVKRSMEDIFISLTKVHHDL